MAVITHHAEKSRNCSIVLFGRWGMALGNREDTHTYKRASFYLDNLVFNVDFFYLYSYFFNVISNTKTLK